MNKYPAIAQNIVHRFPILIIDEAQDTTELQMAIIDIFSQYGADSMGFCKALLKEQGVALVPGCAFGMEGFVRLSFACSLEELEEGIARIEQFVKALFK